MTEVIRKPALGAEDWFTEEGGPALLGSRCTACGTVAFPRVRSSCPNPRCANREHVEHRLSSTGTVWSYTDAAYQPPPPYIPTTDPFEPFVVVAVELAAEKLTVLGQLAAGHGFDDLRVGAPVELVVEPLFVDEDGIEHTIWKWRPADG
ncbi:MAG: Zn-ribbon domain-containing OB-fold protein [Acidimicrobiia bacterium]